MKLRRFWTCFTNLKEHEGTLRKLSKIVWRVNTRGVEMAEEGTGLGRLLQNESGRKGLLELKVVAALGKSMDVSSIERLMSV